jgi:hypothetical protein
MNAFSHQNALFVGTFFEVPLPAECGTAAAKTIRRAFDAKHEPHALQISTKAATVRVKD